MSRPIEELPAFVEGLFEKSKEVLLETVVRIKSRVAVEGAPVRYPVQWDSEKQRRAYFASNGFGKGIPYQRTGRTRLSWQEERTPFGANLRGEHPAGAVFGTPSGWQSRIHRTRWVYLLDVLFDELSRIPDEISRRLTVRGD